jgi:hypothetical protein
VVACCPKKLLHVILIRGLPRTITWNRTKRIAFSVKGIPIPTTAFSYTPYMGTLYIGMWLGLGILAFLAMAGRQRHSLLTISETH